MVRAQTLVVRDAPYVEAATTSAGIAQRGVAACAAHAIKPIDPRTIGIGPTSSPARR